MRSVWPGRRPRGGRGSAAAAAGGGGVAGVIRAVPNTSVSRIAPPRSALRA